MAKRRRTKQRKGPRTGPERSQTSTMSSEESYAPQSGRQSSDGTLSEHAASDGAHTAMTSIIDTDEEIRSRDSEFDDEEELDIISIYPAMHYPHAAGTNNHDRHFSPNHSHSANSDM